MGARAIPPVDPGNLARQGDLAPEDRLRPGEHLRCVALEGGGVPLQEKASLLRLVALREEVRVLWLAVVGARGRGVRGLRPALAAGGLGRSPQAGQRVRVAGLELADAAVAPLAQGVGRVPQLARRAEAHHDLDDGPAQVRGEGAGEGGEPVAVQLQGGPVAHGRVVREQRDVLAVLALIHVLVPDALGVADKRRQRDVTGVIDVATALVK
mmetsp:Transcript_61488/g.197943  ORF Transcript_61488/g.197943 Transcript_61488/m.197943 type:complete len:211 (-) Transcript_61488:641-1273(-)